MLDDETKPFPPPVSAELPVFRYGDEDHCLHEILAWAEFTGRLESMVRELCRTQRAVEGTQDIDSDHLQQAADEWRYRMGLITAEETAAWMCERRLHRHDLYRHFFRGFCRDPVDMAMDIREWCEAVPDLIHELWAELHFSGQFDVICEDFLFRVAAVAKQTRPTETTSSALNVMGASHLSRILMEGYVDHVRRLEGAFLSYAEKVAGYETLVRRMKSRRLDLLRIEYRSLSFADADTAQEAYCCLVHDHEDPYHLANRVDVLIQSGSGFVEDLPEELGRHLLSAQKGEYLEPIQLADRGDYTVCWLLSKSEPHVSIPAVADRLRRSILTEVLRSEIESKLTWLPWNQEETA